MRISIIHITAASLDGAVSAGSRPWNVWCWDGGCTSARTSPGHDAIFIRIITLARPLDGESANNIYSRITLFRAGARLRDHPRQPPRRGPLRVQAAGRGSVHRGRAGAPAHARAGLQPGRDPRHLQHHPRPPRQDHKEGLRVAKQTQPLPAASSACRWSGGYT